MSGWRDPQRKLGWEDRLVGLIRLGLAEIVPTPRYAMGVAAGLEILERARPQPGRDVGDLPILLAGGGRRGGGVRSAPRGG